MGTLYIDDSLASSSELLSRIITVAPELKRIGYIIKAESRGGQSELSTRLNNYKGNKNIIKHLNNIIAANQSQEKNKPKAIFRGKSGITESFSADTGRPEFTGDYRPAQLNNKSKTNDKPITSNKGDINADEMNEYFDSNFGAASSGISPIDE